MSDGLNSCSFIGNLGQDPELRALPGGQSILKLSIGVNESYLDKNNVRQEKVEWVRATVWGRRAEGLAKILTKGSRIYVDGSLHTSSYEKNGEKRYSTEINVRNVILCGGNREASDSAGGSGGGRRGRSAPADEEPRGQEFGPDVGSPPPDDDIPF